jgi:hypothetical protein
MRSPRTRAWLAAAVAVGILGGYSISQGMAAGGTPANKAVASGSHRQSIAVNSSEKLMSATFKTSKPEDLILQLTAECTILTDLVLPGSDQPGAAQEATAQGAVRLWVTLDGNIVPIEDVSNPPQDPSANGKGTDADKVTFCDRMHRRSVSDKEDPQNGLDSDEDYQNTKSANAFNWVRLNAGSGMHLVEVWGEFKTSGSGSGGGSATAKAYVGNRTLVIEPTKLANDAVISETATS